MSQDASQVRVGVTGKLLVAALGSTLPTDVTTPWAAAWTDLGLIDEKGVSQKPSMSKKDIKSWQSFYPVRTVITERGLEWKVRLIQKTGSVLRLAHGGGTVTALGGGIYKFTPPSPTTIDERSFGLEVVDGSIIDRYYIQRSIVSDTGDIQFVNNDSEGFELTLTTLNPAAGNPWEMISNDAAMAV